MGSLSPQAYIFILLHVDTWVLEPTLMVVCWNPFLWGPWCPWVFGSSTHTYGGLMALGCYMVIGTVYPCDHAYESHKVLKTCGMVFGTLMCGVFDVFNILKNLRVFEQEFSNKTIIGR